MTQRSTRGSRVGRVVLEPTEAAGRTTKEEKGPAEDRW